MTVVLMFNGRRREIGTSKIEEDADKKTRAVMHM